VRERTLVAAILGRNGWAGSVHKPAAAIYERRCIRVFLMRLRLHSLFLVILSLAAALASSGAAQEKSGNRQPVLSVRGVGKIEAKPDYARLSVQAVTVADTLEEAAKAHQERATRALDVLQQMKADGVEIERSSFALNQDRPPLPLANQTQPPPPPKFRANTSFTLRFRRLDRLNQLVTRLADTGVLEVRSIGYGVDQERQALNNARRAAVADAREQAELYAEAAKVKLVEIVEIDNGEARPEDGAADLPTPRFVQVIPPSVVTFNSSVTITWRIRSR
jgi:uncharacterized protein YggE